MVDPITTSIVPILNGVPFDASISSSSHGIKQAVGYSIQFTWAAATSASGAIVVSGSNDDPANTVTQTWTPVASVNVNSNSGDILLNVERAMYGFVQAKFIRSAGSGGSLTAKLCRKNS